MGSERWRDACVFARAVAFDWGWRASACALAFALLAPARVPAETEPALTQYQVEAAFLYHFTKYVTWPAQAFAAPDDPILIGVLGDDPFGDDLRQTVAREKPVQGRPLHIVHGRSVAEVAHCHVLFIGASEQARLGQDFTALRRANSAALTVGESENFLRDGGIVRFVVERNKVRFEIDAANAERAGLTLSSRLLSLARRGRPRS